MIDTILNVDNICQDCLYFSVETNHATNYDGVTEEHDRIMSILERKEK